MHLLDERPKRSCYGEEILLQPDVRSKQPISMVTQAAARA